MLGNIQATSIAELPDHWYVARLRPGGLGRARTNLARQDYRSFMPMRSLTRRRGSRLEPQVRPLFPGYLFVEIPPERENWRVINSTYGIARLVALEGTAPTRVPGDFMAALAACCDGDRWGPSARDLQAGTPVRVLSGPFADLPGRIEALPEADRALVLLEIMGRSVRTTLAPRDLERL